LASAECGDGEHHGCPTGNLIRFPVFLVRADQPGRKRPLAAPFYFQIQRASDRRSIGKNTVLVSAFRWLLLKFAHKNLATTINFARACFWPAVPRVEKIAWRNCGIQSKLWNLEHCHG
jgi:hypothetical protein